MTYWQPEGSVVVPPESLTNALARSLCDRINGDARDFARLAECREVGEFELVSFDIRVERPQRPVYDIRDVESVSVVFTRSATEGYSILVARPDFPDTPHQNLMPEGWPCCLCIDDRPWQDVRSSYTAAELLQRLASWFEKACQGELHGIDQPLDPIFFPSNAHEVILATDVADGIDSGDRLYICTRDKAARFLFLFRGRNPPTSVAKTSGCWHCIVSWNRRG
jgi:hypothetical protein